jgi:phytoene dehydrogenase-like protein
MSGRLDAIVIGGGHNGLVAAFYLARRGLRTVVLERRETLGGACVTEEFAPGYRASPGAYVLSMLRPAIWRDMHLAERGLSVRPAGPSLCLFGDGARFTLHNDDARTVEEIRRYSPADASAFQGFKQELAEIGALVFPTLDAPPSLARFGAHAMRRPQVAERAAALLSTSARRWLDERFDSEHVKAALGWDAISNTLAGPSTPGTALALLHEHAADPGGAVPWGFVPGGMGTVTRLMAEAAREAGAELRTASPVARVIVEDGRACGALLEGGEELRARVVLSNADPKRTFLGLCGADDLPEPFVRAVEAYRCDGASMKINLAVAELPALPGVDGLGEEHGGLIQLTLPLGEMDRDQESARRGVPAADPHVELCIPTVHDPSLAPAGHHVLTIGARSQPYRLAEGTWDDARESVADGIVEQLGRFMPNLPGAILHRQVLSPLDLERKLGLTGGHHMHGDMLPDQLFAFRPVRGHADHRTPIRNLYLCGAGTHPGGGVTGANGHNCAGVVVRDLRLRRAG